MVVNFIGLNIVLILLHISLCFADEQAVSGPFTSRMEKMTPCERPTRAYVKDSPLVIQVEIYTNNTSNNTLLRGNYTIKKDVKNVKHKTKGYIWKDNQWRSHFIMNDFDCHSIVIYFMYVGVSVKYDRKKCIFLKGQYFFKDVDINTIVHFWTSHQEYGKVKYRFELLDPQLGTYFCNYLYLVTEPAK